MTSFLVDDQLMSNPKGSRLIRAGGANAVALWTLVGSACGAHNTEGLVAASVVETVALLLRLSDRDRDAAVQAIVEVGIWHLGRRAKRCGACKDHLDGFGLKVPVGGWLWHDWNRQNFSAQQAKDPVERARLQRHNRLHSRHQQHIKVLVRQRDGDRCRYCGIDVDFRARRGPNAGTYDHIDPSILDGPLFTKANSLENLVVACNGCNSEKRDRTPQEWGHALLPQPDRASLYVLDGDR